MKRSTPSTSMHNKTSLTAAYDSDSSNASNDDYDDRPGLPLEDDNEFSTASHRRKRQKRSKAAARESAALGVFGSESEDEEYGARGGLGRKKGGFGGALRDGGMSFVGASGTNATEDDDEDESDEEDEEDNDHRGGKIDFSVEATAGLRDLGTGKGVEGYSDYEEDDRPKIGLGGGLGFKAASRDDSEMDIDEEDERPRIGLGGANSSLRPHMFAPRSLGGNSARASGTNTPGSMEGHRGLGFHSTAGSAEQSPAPESNMQFLKRAGLGVGSRGGLGFQKAGIVDSTDLQNQPMPEDPEEFPAPRGSMSNPLGKGFVSSVRQNATMFAPSADNDDEDMEKEKLVVRPSFTDVQTGGRRKAKSGDSDAPVVNQESFAARMMAKMGYKAGQGLGKTGEGRLAPVDTQLRPGRVGLGAVKEMTEQAKKEEKRAKALRGEKHSDSESERERERKRKKKKKAGKLLGDDSGAGSGASTPARRKPKFRTAGEMAKELDASGLSVPSALQNIIDLTGKEAKALDITGGIMKGGEEGGDNEAVKIAKLARRELEDFATEWRRLQERKNFTLSEVARRTEDMDEQAETVKTLQNIVDLTNSLSIGGTSAETRNDFEDNIADLTSKLEKLQFEYKNEIDLYNLSEVAIGAFHPLFKSALSQWDPLSDPVYLLEPIRKLRHIFQIRTMEDMQASLATTGYAEKSGKKSTPYESMMYTIWLPKLRSTINNHWNPHDPSPILTVLETWAGVLPPYIHANILDQLVLPKLKAAVTDWNPRTPSASSKRKPTPPPHIWVFPWLPHLSTHMDELIREVKRKFRVVLDKWDLSRATVVDGLDAWREIFGPNELEKLLINHLLPRLADLLRRKFEVNPAEQDKYIKAFETVMVWHTYFRQSTFSQLLEAEFFPKWIATLYHWLTSEGVELDEVSEWYQWWSKQFPKDVRDSPGVKKQFKKALDMMTQAMDDEGGGPGNILPPESGPVKPIRPSPPPPETTGKNKSKANGKVEKAPLTETTFREYMEEWCSEHGLILMPLRKAHEATGNPLFRITESASGSGGVLCYFAQDVLWAQDRKKKDVFEPMSLEKVEERVGVSHH